MSQMRRSQYRLTPSLLNSFQDLLDCDINYDKFYGDNENATITPEEYFRKCEQELIDACNRVPFVSEAASRGTALNEIVDCILERRKQREDMSVERLYDQPYPPKAIPDKSHIVGLRAALDGFTFDFNIELVNRLTEYFSGSICQYRCEATIDTTFGPVILYGDADYIRRDVVHDLKTTSKYDKFGKYARGWQKHLYPWALIKSGDVTEISGFEYTVVPLVGGNSRTPLINGSIYKEWFDFSFEDSEHALRGITEGMIHWIEEHRNLITHKRIFNQI